MEDDNRFLIKRIKRLEVEIAQPKLNDKFMTARDAALSAEVRPLLEEFRRCPDDDHVHELHLEVAKDRREIERVFDKAFWRKPRRSVLPTPSSIPERASLR